MESDERTSSEWTKAVVPGTGRVWTFGVSGIVSPGRPGLTPSGVRLRVPDLVLSVAGWG